MATIKVHTSDWIGTSEVVEDFEYDFIGDIHMLMFLSGRYSCDAAAMGFNGILVELKRVERRFWKTDEDNGALSVFPSIGEPQEVEYKDKVYIRLTEKGYSRLKSDSAHLQRQITSIEKLKREAAE